MGRNDLCFCGSGKKRKKCHPEIEETSLIGDLLNLYNRFDSKIHDHFSNIGYTSKCERGCAECCYNQLSISEIEYNLIQYELMRWPEDKLEDLILKIERIWNDLNQKHPEFVKKLITSRDGQKVEIGEEQRQITDFGDTECPFLDIFTNSCTIYAVRPFGCRLFGVSYHSHIPDEMTTLCNKLNIEELREFGYNVDEEFKDDAKKLIVWENEKGQVIYKKPLPIIYHLHKSIVGKGITSINNYKSKFEAPESIYKRALFEFVYKTPSTDIAKL